MSRAIFLALFFAVVALVSAAPTARELGHTYEDPSGFDDMPLGDTAFPGLDDMVDLVEANIIGYFWSILELIMNVGTETGRYFTYFSKVANDILTPFVNFLNPYGRIWKIIVEETGLLTYLGCN